MEDISWIGRDIMLEDEWYSSYCYPWNFTIFSPPGPPLPSSSCITTRMKEKLIHQRVGPHQAKWQSKRIISSCLFKARARIGLEFWEMAAMRRKIMQDMVQCFQVIELVIITGLLLCLHRWIQVTGTLTPCASMRRIQSQLCFSPASCAVQEFLITLLHNWTFRNRRSLSILSSCSSSTSLSCCCMQATPMTKAG